MSRGKVHLHTHGTNVAITAHLNIFTVQVQANFLRLKAATAASDNRERARQSPRTRQENYVLRENDLGITVLKPISSLASRLAPFIEAVPETANLTLGIPGG